jgi:hypothetical protein
MTPLDWLTRAILTFVSSVRTMSLPMMLTLSKRAAAGGLHHCGAVPGEDRLEIAADGSASRKTRNRSARPPSASAAGLSKKRVLDRVGDEQVAKMGRRDGRFLDLGKGRLNNGRA